MTAILKTNLIEPVSGTTLTVGETGQNVVIGADTIKANILKDAGDGYKYAAFTSTGAQTWTCPTGVTSAELLIVAGGAGGGGRYYGGGGGAGGVVWDTAYTVVPAVVYDLTVGAGGGGGAANAPGTNGSDSTWNDNAEGSGVKFTAKGGGGGAGGDGGDVGGDGGSGGGRNTVATPGPGEANQQTSGTATSGTITSYGNDGGGAPAVTYSNGSGGGGASAVGGDGLTEPAHLNGGGGGAGQLFSNFTAYGTNAANGASSGTDGGYFGGGGGGGGGGHASLGGPGGVGGGGIGAGYNSGSQIDGVAGTANTGGAGGAGSHSSTQQGKAGGSGVVLIRYQDPTPNAIFTSNGSGVLSGVNAGLGSSEVLISTQTVSSTVSTVDFTSGIDSTYPLYKWEFINISPDSEEYFFRFQVNAVGESGFDEPITSTLFVSRIGENGAQAALFYQDDDDQAQGTAYQAMSGPGANRVFESASGYLYLANPSGTTYAKNFWGRQNSANWDGYTWNNYVAGYINTTAAIDEISFKMEGGNIRGGKIKMYGVK